MAQFKAAQARLFDDMFVCKDCGSKIRTKNLRVIRGLARCRKCGSKDLRPKGTK